jgi:hypothetical protein
MECGQPRQLKGWATYALFAMLYFAACITVSAQESASPQLKGSWKASFADSLFSGTVYLTLDLASDGTVSGSYEATTGGSGTVSGNLDDKTFRFALSQQVEGCPGTFVGSVVLEDEQGKGTYSGTDCKGKHQNGVLSMTRTMAEETSRPAASSQATPPGSAGEVGYADCGGLGKVSVFLPGGGNIGKNGTIVATLTCGQEVLVLHEENGWKRIRAKDNIEGTVKDEYISTAKVPARVSAAPTLAAASVLSQNTLRAIAWRAVPWVTTTYFQQPGSASTECTGSGTWLGNIYQGNASCTTQYTPAQSVPINWTHYTIYNLVETADSQMVLACTRNWAFSKCSYLVPGSEFPFDNKGGKVSVKGQRGGKGKEQTLTFDLVSFQAK